ncbi:hypothetical protein D088_930141 [Salmonella enterica subsp. houtenae serovar 16:z4,z32:-- str. RKS3027]|nr:hypothetical protein D088_930141 [Salmonella enterica subsp. houtenae serovar 16:z4,z32:-- str. RKS3027]
MRRPFYAPYPALSAPGKLTPGCKAQRRFAPALVYAPAANGSQTGEGNNQRARSAGPRKTSKPRPRQLNG